MNKFYITLIILFSFSFNFLINAQYRSIRTQGAVLNLIENSVPELSFEFKNYGSLKNGVWEGEMGVAETVAEIMARELSVSPIPQIVKETENEKIWPDRSNLPQNPGSQSLTYWPPEQDNIIPSLPENDSPQTLGINFTAATVLGINSTNAVPPDCMGAVGPTQYIVAVNGRVVTFNKTTGLADGVLNASTNTFFTSVRNGSGTSDPRIRYDRLSGRWFIIIINVSTPNRILFAVSDAVSNGIISGSTVWTYFFIPIESISPPISNTCLADYPTLGIDNNALYIGTNNFCGSPSQTFNSSDGYVIRKSSILSAGPIVVTVFRGLVPTSASAGPYTPQGVDNFDAASTDGYFIGVDNATFGTLMLRRVTNPGAAPSITSNISITVNSTSFPLTVPHFGNTGGTNGNLSALDDRLFMAVIRNGNLWTAHNINVTSGGIGSSTGTRTGSRWYQINNLSGTPGIVQSGTIFSSASTNPTYYWIPSISISGQRHVAMGFSVSGNAERINGGTVGRLSSDASGLMGTPLLFTNSSTAYNPTFDAGGVNGRRWGDYSFVSVDPQNDMTMWTVQEFCDAANSYGVRVVQLNAPPPATIDSCSPGQVASQQNINVTVNGTSTNGSGFFDPGNDPGGPGFQNHISASIPGVTVNSVTFNSPTEVTLNITIGNVTAGSYNITITNPDGQSSTGIGILQIDDPLPVELTSFSATTIGSTIKLNWNTATEVNNYGFEVERCALIAERETWNKIGFVEGSGNSNSPKDYSFIDEKVSTGKYSYRLKQIDNDGQFEYSKTIEVDFGAPKKFELSQNYPNPFNPTTTIRFNLPETGNVKLTLFNILGQEIRTLVNEVKEAGTYTINLNASELNSGMYIYKIETGSFIQTRKMTLVK
jgi:hypothetical protein